MTKLAWVALPALTFWISTGCGGDDPAAAPVSPDGSSNETGGRKGTGGSAGKHTGGQHDGGGVSGTGPVDSGPPADTTPPEFSGAKNITALGEDRARIGWDLATDPQPGSTQDQIGYRVYRASTAGGHDFTVTRRCGDALPDAGPIEQATAPCYAVAPAGATSLIVRDAVPFHEFWYVVRAVDAAGNEDTNTAEVHAKNDDKTSPDFGGVSSVGVESAFSIQVGWNAGYDLGAADRSLTFKVWVRKGAAPDTSQPPTVTSKPGQHSVIVTGLEQLSSYYVIVRAADPAGNTDENTRVLTVTTPEGVGPTFDGAKLARADGKTVRVFWPPATDNNTDSASIVYDVYESLTSHVYDYSKPSYTSAPGASSIAVTEPNAGTRYNFVVRARDSVGNRDGNTKEIFAITKGIPDVTAPLFGGVQSVQSLTPTTLQATWKAANETDVTYLVYVSTTTPVPLTTPVLTTRALAATITGRAPSTAYNVTVVAQDAASNKSANPATLAGTTLPVTADVSPPTGTGTPLAAILPSAPSTQLGISWTAATDDVDIANVRYHICVGTTPSECSGAAAFQSHLALTTAFGAVTATVSNLTPRTTYYVNVRAEDHGGNIETGDHTAAGTTPTSWAANVKDILFYRCIACHGYDVHPAIFNIPGNLLDNAACPGVDSGTNGCQLKLIDPGRPQYSIIYRKINAFGLQTLPFSASNPNQFNGLQEPRDSAGQMTPDEIDTLRKWIEQGAFAN